MSKQKCHQRKRQHQRKRAAQRPQPADARSVITGQPELALMLPAPALHKFSTASLLEEIKTRQDVPGPLSQAIVDCGQF
jgi:hypothetical protein